MSACKLVYCMCVQCSEAAVPIPLQAPKTTYQDPAEKEMVEKMRETAKKRAEVGVRQHKHPLP